MMNVLVPMVVASMLVTINSMGFVLEPLPPAIVNYLEALGIEMEG